MLSKRNIKQNVFPWKEDAKEEREKSIKNRIIYFEHFPLHRIIRYILDSKRK